MLWIIIGLLVVIASTLLFGTRVTKAGLVTGLVAAIGAAIGGSIDPFTGTGLGAMVGLIASASIFALARRGAEISQRS